MTLFLENISGGSDYGLSKYRLWTKCPKQAHLKEQHQISLSKKEKRIHFQKQTLSFSGLSVGIMGHLLLENYFAKKLRLSTTMDNIVWKHEYNLKAFKKAFHTVNIWMQVFKDINFKVISIEENIQIRNKKTFIISPYSGRLDLVINLTKKDISDLKKLRNPYTNEPIITNIHAQLTPGLWIVDHKFYGTETVLRLLEAYDNLAYASYPKLYQLKHNKKITGIIQNTLYTTKQPKFKMYILKPRPLKKFKIEMRKVLKNKENPLTTDINWCLNNGFHKPCYYRMENICKGI